MNKVNIPGEVLAYIREHHLLRYKNKIVKEIEAQHSRIDWSYTNIKFGLLLTYLKNNIDKLLGGTPEELLEIVNHIEEYYFVDSSRINILIELRKKQKVKRGAELAVFIRQHNLEYYLGNDSFSLIYKFNFAMKEFAQKQKVVLSSTDELSFNQALEEIFNYEDFYEDAVLSNSNVWGAYEYLQKLECNICPYCDRQFIYTFNKNKKKVRAELDHFYPKSIYPYLALSIMNLVPSCHQCNSSFKGAKDPIELNLLNPFSEGFNNNLCIKILGKDANVLMGLSTNFEIDFSVETSDVVLADRIRGSIRLFALNENYVAHKMYVKDLIRKSYIYDELMLGDIKSILEDSSYSIEELRRITFPEENIDQNSGKHVLTKLSYDILKAYRR
ncbi:HNH endonuclease [Sporosarcina sp. FA15]|uniref:HNH endonuclease n=1 Tax=Sporosarcina sp. FA15 TaxID=3413031 RepID=UPI003F6605CB